MNQLIRSKHLLWRAGFGPNLKEFQALQKETPSILWDRLWKDSQKYRTLIANSGTMPKIQELRKLSKEQRKKLNKEGRQQVRDLNILWFEEMVAGPSQLRDKMAFFWHDHFACQPRNIFHAQQYLETIRGQALGNFGDLVLAVSKTPAMLQYLNNQQNRKRSPNENFARELMELFTLGRGHYSEKDIKESARAFTGWGFNGADFVFRERIHDFDQKEFMGIKGNFNGDDIIKIILDNPQTATYITEKLYKFLVSEKINPAHIKSLSKYFYETRYDIGKLLKKIFLSDWFYEEKVMGNRIKSPIELLVGLQRQLNMKLLAAQSALFMQKVLGQMLFFPPNVAGWASGKAWIDSSSLMFRLKLPMSLYKASALLIEAKAEGDVNRMGMVPKRIKNFQADFQWEGFHQFFGPKTDPRELYQALSEYFLQSKAPKPEDYAFKFAEKDSSEKLMQSMSILLTATPEYQIC